MSTRTITTATSHRAPVRLSVGPSSEARRGSRPFGVRLRRLVARIRTTRTSSPSVQFREIRTATRRHHPHARPVARTELDTFRRV